MVDRMTYDTRVYRMLYKLSDGERSEYELSPAVYNEFNHHLRNNHNTVMSLGTKDDTAGA
jgi:hypothetical protein